MTWHIDFVAPNKKAAIDALMHPLACFERGRGLPIAVREQIIVMIEMLSDQDSAAFVHIKTHGLLTGERSAAAVNMNIEVRLVPSYLIPANAQ